jgi:anti-anti-sigma factor
VNPNGRGSRSDDGGWPPGIGDAVPGSANLSLVVGRCLGTVVVTVDGELDVPGCERLRGVLSDLIEGQGNRAVAVDLTKAIVEPNALDVFIEAAHQSRRQGTKFILKEPPTDTHEALHSAGFGDLIDVLPRRPSGGQVSTEGAPG